MNEVTTKRNTWVACPKCGHKVAKVRTCDMELKCKHCGYEFEAVIGPSHLSFSEEKISDKSAPPPRQ